MRRKRSSEIFLLLIICTSHKVLIVTKSCPDLFNLLFIYFDFFFFNKKSFLETFPTDNVFLICIFTYVYHWTAKGLSHFGSVRLTKTLTTVNAGPISMLKGSSRFRKSERKFWKEVRLVVQHLMLYMYFDWYKKYIEYKKKICQWHIHINKIFAS